MVTCQEATNQKVCRTSYKAKLKAVCGSDIPKYEKPLPRKIPAEALIVMTLYAKRFLWGNQPRLSCPSTQSTVTVEPVVMLPSSSFLLSMVSTVCCT